MEKKIVSEEVEHDFMPWEYDISIDDIEKDLVKLKEQGATHISIEAEDSYGQAMLRMKAYFNRKETDEELAKRMKNEEIKEQQQIQKDIALYKHLQKKLEGKL